MSNYSKIKYFSVAFENAALQYSYGDVIDRSVIFPDASSDVINATFFDDLRAAAASSILATCAPSTDLTRVGPTLQMMPIVFSHRKHDEVFRIRDVSTLEQALLFCVQKNITSFRFIFQTGALMSFPPSFVGYHFNDIKCRDSGPTFLAARPATIPVPAPVPKASSPSTPCTMSKYAAIKTFHVAFNHPELHRTSSAVIDRAVVFSDEATDAFNPNFLDDLRGVVVTALRDSCTHTTEPNRISTMAALMPVVFIDTAAVHKLRDQAQLTQALDHCVDQGLLTCHFVFQTDVFHVPPSFAERNFDELLDLAGLATPLPRPDARPLTITVPAPVPKASSPAFFAVPVLSLATADNMELRADLDNDRAEICGPIQVVTVAPLPRSTNPNRLNLYLTDVASTPFDALPLTDPAALLASPLPPKEPPPSLFALAPATCLDDDFGLAIDANAAFSYRELLGALLYAYMTCRPVIGFALITLAKFSATPS